MRIYKILLFFTLFLLVVNPKQSMAQVPFIPEDGLVGYWPFAGNANDSSGNGLHGTVSGAVLTNDRFGRSNNAYDFDGVNDYISVSHNSLLSLDTSFTISVWVNIDNYPTKSGGILVKGDHGENHGKDHNYYMAVSNNSSTSIKEISAAYENSVGNNTIASIDSIGNGYLDRWTHLVGVRDHQAKTLKLYVDGVLVYTHANATDDPNTNTEALVFGKFYSVYSAEFFDGAIDDIAIWNRAFTEKEVGYLYNDSFEVGFVYTDTCAGISVNFFDTSAPALSFWRWNFGDPSSGSADSSNLQNPVHVFSDTGTYTITLIAGNKFGADTVVKNITILEAPTVSAAGDTTICPGDSIQLSSTGSGTIYSWAPARLIENPAAANPTVTAYGATNFIVEHSDTITGCRVYDTVVVDIDTSSNCSFTNIGGVINSYAAVTAIDTCENYVTVDTASFFSPGDRVMLIQMKGATISTSSTSAGSVTNYNNAGNYELLTVNRIDGLRVYFEQKILREYTVSGLVQLVRIPVYENIKITSPLTARAWNGTKGGILALEAIGAVIQYADMDVNGKGFRGGAVHSNYVSSCSSTHPGYTDNFCSSSSARGSSKGEGIGIVTNLFCRAPLGNGGGGGNYHNSGGAGGGNFGEGGDGGEKNDAGCKGYYPGIGGNNLTFNQNKIFLGGGGGSGEANDNSSTAGGDGGGIIFILTENLITNNHSLLAKGEGAATAGQDGSGGGGAGGAVLLDYNQRSDSLKAFVDGGKGGDNDNSNLNRCHGTGGGGGGGLVWLKSNVSPSDSKFGLSGGIPGIITNSNSSCYNSNQNATAGDSGGVLNNLIIPQSTKQFLRPELASSDNAICYGDSVQLFASGGASYSWSPTAGLSSATIANPVAKPEKTTQYVVTITASTGCIYTDTVQVTLSDSLGCPIPSVGGIVNKYAAVDSFDKCYNRFLVDDASGFVVGYNMLLMQMQGATINSSNNSSYGGVTNYNSAGKFELLSVDSIVGNWIYSYKLLKNNYNWNGRVQLVQSPPYSTVNIQQTITPQPWNGRKGGVVSIIADSVILNADINATGKGFRGAKDYNYSTTRYPNAHIGGNGNYYRSTGVDTSALKGEGIAGRGIGADTLGIGAPANGGGGGNAINAGGGGGANYGSGGKGGNGWNSVTSNNIPNGIGGYSLASGYNNGRLFMGGGGGAGQENNEMSTAGENGGGIVLISAKTIKGNSSWIRSNGLNAQEAGGDGAGGGGAGGTIFLNTDTISSLLNIEAKGGAGGDVDYPSFDYGPGGGGGGGAVIFKTSAIPLNVTVSSLAGGAAGISTNTNGTYGAVAGSAGDTVFNYSLLVADSLFVPFTVFAGNDTSLCMGDSIQLSATAAAVYSWSPANSLSNGSIANPYAFPTDTTEYILTATDSARCVVTDTVIVIVHPLPTVSATPATWLSCPQDTIQLIATGADSYSWWPNSQISDTAVAAPFVSPNTITNYIVTGTDTLGCQNTDTVTVNVRPITPLSPPRMNSASITSDSTIDICWGLGYSSSEFGSYLLYRMVNGGTATIIDTISSAGTVNFSDTVANADSLPVQYFISVVNYCGIEGSPSDTISSIILSASNEGDKTINLIWNAPSGNFFGSYDVQQDVGSGFSTIATISNTNYSISSCNLNARYRIYTNDSCDISSNPTDFIHVQDTTPPPFVNFFAASNFGGGSGNESQFLLTWQNSDSIDTEKYYFYKKEGTGNWQLFDSVSHNQVNSVNTLLHTGSAGVGDVCFRIQAVDTCGNLGDFSPVHCPPTIFASPGNLRADLNWNAYSGFSADTVEVQRLVNGTWTTISYLGGSDTAFTDSTSLYCNRPYSYRVVYHEAGGNEMFSISDSATVIPFDTIPPAAPDVLSATVNANNTSITIRFDTVPDIDIAQYELYYSVNGGSFSQLGTVNQQNQQPNEFTHNNINPTTNRYCYYLVAVDSCGGNRSVPSDTHCVAELSATAGNTRAELQWQEYEGFVVDRYVIERLDNNTWTAIDSVSSTTTSFTDTGRACNYTYTYRIRSMESGGSEISYSDTAQVVPFDTIRPPQVNILAATVNSASEVELTFNTVNHPDVNRYQIYSSTNGGSYSLLQTLFYPGPGLVNFFHTNINTTQNTYSYRVFAVDSCADNISPTSEEHTTIQLTGQGRNLSNELNWSQYQGFSVDEYEVQKFDGSNWNTITSLSNTDTTYLDTGLACNVTYIYRIKATEDGGDNAESLSDTIHLTPFDTIRPAEPHVKFATALNNSQTYLEWEHSTSSDVKRYIIYRKPAGGNFAAIDTVAYVTDYTDAVDTRSGSFCYAVAAVDSCADNESDLSVTHCTVNLIADTTDCEQHISLSWNSYSGWSGGVSSYDIYRIEVGGTENFLATVGGSANNFTDSNLDYHITYCYRIEANENGGTAVSSSNDSCQRPFEPAIPEVTYVSKTATSTTAGEVKVKWTAITGTRYNSHYRLYYSADGNTFSVLANNIPITLDSFLHQNINTKTADHHYYLAMVDSCGTESDSVSIHKTMDLDFDIGQLIHDLKWTPYQGFTVQNYIVQQEIGGNWIDTDTLPATDTALIKFPAPCNYDIIYRIAAISSTGAISYSDTAINRAIDTIPSNPPAMFNVSVENGNVLRVEFIGADSMDLYGFDIRRSADGGNFSGTKFRHFTTPSENFTVYDTINTLDNYFCYTVVALDSCLNAAASDTFCAIQLKGQPVNLGNEVNWHPFVGYPVDSYYVLHHNGSSYDTLAVVPGTDTSYQHLPLSCNVTHFYKILAAELGGTRISFSDSIALTPFDTIPPAAPEILFATVQDSQSIYLEWMPSSADVLEYEVSIKEGSGSWQVLDTLGQQQLLVNDLNTLDSVYCFRIVAIDSCGPNRSEPSIEHCPVQLEGITQNLANNLFWTDYVGWNSVSKYRIYNWNNGWNLLDSVDGNTTTYNHNFLPCNVAQQYKIEAVDGTENFTSWSDTIQLIPFDTIAPDSPYIRLTSVTGANTLEVTFDTSAAWDVLFYQIWASENGGAFTVIDTLFPTGNNPLVYNHTGANTSGNRYCYYIKAYDYCSDLNVSVASNIHCPVNLTGTEKNLANQLDWFPYVGFDTAEYIVQRLDTGVWKNLTNLRDTFWTDTPLICNVSYTYRIQTTNSTGTDTSYSNEITLTPFDTIPPAAPRLKSVSVQLDQNILVNWETSISADVKFYEVWRRDESGSTSLLNTVVYDSSYIDSTANSGSETYQYYVIAIDSCNTANRSTPSDTDRTMMAEVATGACVPLARLSWNSYVELPDTTDGYFIWRSDNGGSYVQMGQSTDSFYVDSTILENNSYCYRIEAFDVQSGYTAFSDTVCMEPWVFPAPAAANMDVITVTATGTTTGEMYVEWQQADVNDTFARGYYLYHATQNSTYSRIHDETDLNTTSFTHSGINTETDTHFYYVSTYNLCYVDADTSNPHIEGDSSEIHRNINLEAQNNNLEAELSWSLYQGFDISRYELYRRVDGDNWYLYDTFSSTDSTYTDNNLRCDINYSYKIVGFELNGFRTTESDTLTIMAFDTIPPTAADMFYATVTATDPATGSIELEFTPATETNREGYIIYRQTNGGNWVPVDSIKTSQTTDITYTDIGLNTKDDTYGYFVASYDSCGNESLPVDTHIVVHLDVVPQSKANLLNWSNYYGFVNFSYTVERRTDATSWVPLITLNDTFYNDSTTMCDTLYTYRILVESTDGNISYSNLDTATGLELEPPLEPKVHRATVTATGTTNGEVLVEWNASPSNDADFYTLYRREAGTGTWTEAATNIMGLSYTDQNINTSDISYEYRLSVTDMCDNVSVDYSDIHRTIQLTATPGNQEIRLDWNHYGGWSVQQYEVYRDGVLYETLPGTATTYTDTLVLCINVYSYKVVAYADSSVAITSESNTSEAQNYDTKAPQPVYLKTASVSNPNDEVFIEWEETTDFDAKNYVLWRKMPGERRWQEVARPAIGVTTYTNPVQIGDEPVCYRVTVEDYCDNFSAESNLGCIIIPTGTAEKLHNIIYWTSYEQWTQGVNRYRIYRSDDGNLWQQIGEVNGTTLTYKDSSLGDEDVTDFCYQIEAVEEGGPESESKSKVICLQQEPLVWVPNAFTPTRSAGINDGFEPDGLYIASYQMRIYNRWGGLVYETANSQPWNGKSLHGDYVQEGVYAYEIKVISHTGKTQSFTGTVTLLR